MSNISIHKGTPHRKKSISFGHCPNYLPPLPPGKLYNFFRCEKRRLARITEPSNGDYDNGVSDNCDQNFGTFDDFVLKMTKKYTHKLCDIT